jgi:hypothetical protein
MIIPSNVKHLHQLNRFDRFCFLKDKKARKVWQVVEHIIVPVMGEPKRMTKCINDSLDTKRFDSMRAVYFLRNNNPYKRGSRITHNPELLTD